MKKRKTSLICTTVMISLLILLTYSCKKPDAIVDVTIPSYTIPVLTTSTVTSITLFTASCGGSITSSGGSSVTVRGVCWSTSASFTIENCLNKTTDGAGAGSFTSAITGLNGNTKYYVRAYATNSTGTGYGDLVSFTTITVLATVTTDAISSITQFTASGGGNVTFDGSSTVTARGVCWSASSNPTTSDSHTTDGSGTGSFTSNITGLTAYTPYYVRAYATNSAGTSYGSQVSFTTSFGSVGEPCPGMPTITDSRDGQVYPTVQIGSQCWLQKNMNYSTGNSWCYDNNTSNCNTYGRLYDWQTALGACPSGWHLPSDAEWTALTVFLGGESIAGGKMKEAGTAHWSPPNTGATNSSGFTALPGGNRDYYFGYFFYDLTGYANFWSSSQNDATGAWGRYLIYCSGSVNRYLYSIETRGFSARCVHD